MSQSPNGSISSAERRHARNSFALLERFFFSLLPAASPPNLKFLIYPRPSTLAIPTLFPAAFAPIAARCASRQGAYLR